MSPELELIIQISIFEYIVLSALWFTKKFQTYIYLVAHVKYYTMQNPKQALHMQKKLDLILKTILSIFFTGLTNLQNKRVLFLNTMNSVTRSSKK